MNRAGLTVCLWRKLSLSKSTTLLNRLQCDHLSSFCFVLHILTSCPFFDLKRQPSLTLTAVSTIKEPDKCYNPVLFSRFLDHPYIKQWHHDWTIFELTFYTDSFFLTWIRYQIMMKCWEEKPNDRPAFEKLRKTMKDMERNNKVKYQRINLKKDYIFFKASGIIQLIFVYHDL